MNLVLKCLHFLAITDAVTKCCRHIDIGFKFHHRCVTRNESYISYSSPNRHHCNIDCSRRLECQVVNFNALSQMCYLTDESCLILEADGQYHATYYKPSSDTCLTWVPLGQHRPERMISMSPCNIPTMPSHQYCYIVRRISIEHVLPGKVYLDDETFTTWDGSILQTGSWEALEVSLGCPIQWVPYTPGSDLPRGSVVGGHIEPGQSSNLYIVRVTASKNGHDVTVPGYYDPATQIAYAVFWGAHIFTEMEMLVVE